ncbi:MAG: hypothetical protein L6R39_004781 [Caloplaca ligustica]|nr:MAG: hypothetical protein L6R39_004781 [Caloplaca ligustica]
MSRSHSYSSNYSRGSRPSRTPSLAVTEASFQGLQLSETSIPSTYDDTSNQYSSRGSYAQESLNPNYLAPGYDTASFASHSSTGGYLGSQRGVSPFAALDTESGTYYDPEASAYNKSDMSGDASSSRRSMSYPSGPHVLPSLVLDTFSTEDREVARQRRRRLQESRRLAKARVRRARLPTIVEPETSMGMSVGGSIDFLAAPSTSSSYDIGGSSGYPRTTSAPSAPYLSGVTG